MSPINVPRIYSRDEVRAIPIHARTAMRSAITGESRTPTRGAQGLEFSDFREYQPGDEIGRIDWNVTARLGKPWVRRYHEERGHPVLLLVDVSASTEPVRQVITDLAARLASAAIWNGCETGLLLFAARTHEYLPPAGGIAQLSDIVRKLKLPAKQDNETNIAAALDFLRALPQRRSLVFLLSDFLSEDFAPALRRCAGRHEIVALQIEDPNAHELPECGILHLRDPETGAPMQIDTGNAYSRAAFATALRSRSQRIAESIRTTGIDHLELAADPVGYLPRTIAFLHQRAH